MAEQIVSPGVFTRERDQSFLPAGIASIGAAIIGPTVKGPAGIPTKITSYSEYIQTFGSVFSSGSGAAEKSYKYLTSYAVEEYLKYADSVTVVRILAGSYSPAYSYVVSTGSLASGGASGASFRLWTLADGAILNSGQSASAAFGSGSTADEVVSGSGALVNASASVDNLRWEISNVDASRGTFSLGIRRGDDNNSRKIYLEQFNNVTLDPNSSNYIAKVIGDQKYNVVDAGTSSPFLQLSGSYPNQSKYVRVEVLKTTLNYLDANGTGLRVPAASASLPAPVSGTFAFGSDGNVVHPFGMYDSISNTNTQGFNLGQTASGSAAYNDAINLLANQDEYDINLLALPGLVDNFANHATVITNALNMVENRGDAFLVIDPVGYGSALTTAATQAGVRNSSYAAMYWPWIQIGDADLGANVWVPAGVLIPGVYSFNDSVAAEWFAPAGLNRGGIESAIQTERKLTQSNRDTLYSANVNPIASFPGQGICVWGQKTLQKKASALDRINVRRLLIAAKKFIASSSKFLVFEQNTATTRNRFLSIANPYFESVQQRQGLYAFKVVMDDTNNTPDVVDRNELRGQIFLQPAKTAEFIIVDFNILPTGAAFPG
jgi:hypothetical protein